MEVFVIAIAAIGIVVVSYAYSAARQILADREERSKGEQPKSSLAFWFPESGPAEHPVHGSRQYDRRVI